jgi:hypothetical protein
VQQNDLNGRNAAQSVKPASARRGFRHQLSEDIGRTGLTAA